MDFELFIIHKLFDPDKETYMKAELKMLNKNENLAVRFKKLGNDIFIKCHHDEIAHERILDSYLNGIKLAPNDSEILATSYANLSALLYHLQKYQECITNIERALQITESITLKIKLLCREAKCLKWLKDLKKDTALEEAKSWMKLIKDEKSKEDLSKLISNTEAVLNKNDKDRKKQKRGIMLYNSYHMETLAEKLANGIFKSIAIRETLMHGKHLVVKKNIKPGEIIAVVKSYVNVPNLNRIQTVCNNCLDIVWSGVPCKNCASVIFCSNECHHEALQRYHDIECTTLQFFSSNNSTLDYLTRIAFRAVLMAVKEFKTLDCLRSAIKKIQNCSSEIKKPSKDKEEYNHSSFLNILSYKNVYVEPETFEQLAESSCQALISLARFSKIFGDQKCDSMDSILKNEDAIFVGTLILRVAVIAHNNSIKVTESDKPCHNNFGETCISNNPCCERGYSLNTLSSIIPHSCNPNVKTMKTKGGKEIIYALQPIQEGKAIFECYGATFFQSKLTDRSDHTSQILNKYCQCSACIQNWPAVLSPDGKHLNFDEMLDVVVNSREYPFQKKKFLFFLSKFGVAHQIVINELSDILIASCDYFGQPSIEVCAAICLLHYAFDELYGIKYSIPEKCNSN